MPLVELLPSDGIVVLTLRNPPANALKRALLGELAALLDELDREKPRAVVISGGDGRFFSAGLDLVELPDLEPDAVKTLGSLLNGTLLRLFRLPCPVLAAVNGHAIAGGAILALTAQHRIGVRGKALFGLNEVQVGLPLPATLFEIVRSQIGEAHLARVVLAGHNHSVEEALTVGLLQEVVEPTELLERTVSLARKLAGVPRNAHARMKELLRARAEERIRNAPVDDEFFRIWFEPETRQALRAARERLTRARPEGR